MQDDDRVLIFDLDDTLYLERDFARSGFAAAGDWFCKETGIADLAERCLALFDAGTRTRVFDEALAEMDVSNSSDLVPALVDVYRGHVPVISLTPDAKRYLDRRAANARFAIITDGPAATQMAKVKALCLDDMIGLIVYTDCWGRDFWKPHTRAFETVQDWAGVEPSRLVYIADNPLKDFLAPKSLGWLTVRILRKERVHLSEAPAPSHEAHADIPDLDALDHCLATLGARQPPQNP